MGRDVKKMLSECIYGIDECLVCEHTESPDYNNCEYQDFHNPICQECCDLTFYREILDYIEEIESKIKDE